MVRRDHHALGACAVLWIQAGDFSREVEIALVGIITQAIVAYPVRNQDTQGGCRSNSVCSTSLAAAILFKPSWMA